MDLLIVHHRCFVSYNIQYSQLSDGSFSHVVVKHQLLTVYYSVAHYSRVYHSILVTIPLIDS